MTQFLGDIKVEELFWIISPDLGCWKLECFNLLDSEFLFGITEPNHSIVLSAP